MTEIVVLLLSMYVLYFFLHWNWNFLSIYTMNNIICWSLFSFLFFSFSFLGWMFGNFKGMSHVIGLGCSGQRAIYISHSLSVISKSGTKVFNFYNCHGLQGQFIFVRDQYVHGGYCHILIWGFTLSWIINLAFYLLWTNLLPVKDTYKKKKKKTNMFVVIFSIISIRESTLAHWNRSMLILIK